MAASSLAHLKVPFRIIDRRRTKIFTGQADGLQCRSLEIFDSLGFADRVWKEANHMIEICMWNPDPDSSSGNIRRSDRIPDTIVGLSRFQQIVLHQGRIERFFLDNIGKYYHHGGPGSWRGVERGVVPEGLEILGEGEFPVRVQLRGLSEQEAGVKQVNVGVEGLGGKSAGNIGGDGLFRSNLGDHEKDEEEEELMNKARDKGGESEVVNCKYVIGCDGARSWTRRALGFELDGEATDFIWGVMDIIPITDFREFLFFLKVLTRFSWLLC